MTHKQINYKMVLIIKWYLLKKCLGITKQEMTNFGGLMEEFLSFVNWEKKEIRLPMSLLGLKLSEN